MLNLRFLLIPFFVMFFNLNALASSKIFTVYSQKIPLQSQLCAEHYTTLSTVSAVCKFHISNTSPSYDLATSSILHNWSYDSTNDWHLNLWLKRSANGFTVDISASNELAQDYLNFQIAEKYITSLFESYKKPYIETLVLKKDDQHNSKYETKLGEAYLAKREVQLTNLKLVETCLQKLTGREERWSCVVKFVSASRGELSLSNQQKDFSYENENQKITASFYAKSAWTELGSFGPIVFRIDWQGLPDKQKIQDYYFEALKKVAQPKLTLIIQKIGDHPSSNELFTESIISPLYVQFKNWNFNSETCLNNSKLFFNEFNCSLSIDNLKFYLGTDEVLYEAQESDKETKFTLRVQRLNNQIFIKLKSSTQLRLNKNQAANYVQTLLKNAPLDIYKIVTFHLLDF